VRVAAIQALAELNEATVKPVLTALRTDPDAEIRNILQPAPRRARVNTIHRLEAAADGTLPNDPDALKSAIARSATAVPLSMLHQIIERVRLHEGSVAQEVRVGWMGARASTHLALVGREKITRRHAVAKKIEKRSPGVWEALLQSGLR
jgi:hypothetical protein